MITMIFGNPAVFAILIEYIPLWGDDTYKNGVFHFCIDGFFFPAEISDSYLYVDVSELLSERHPFISFPEDKDLFEGEKSDSFEIMLRMVYPSMFEDIPDDVSESYLYKAATTILEDDGYIVFAVTYGDMVRVLGAKISERKRDVVSERNVWHDIDTPDIKEVFLNKSEVSEMIKEINEFKLKLWE